MTTVLAPNIWKQEFLQIWLDANSITFPTPLRKQPAAKHRQFAALLPIRTKTTIFYGHVLLKAGAKSRFFYLDNNNILKLDNFHNQVFVPYIYICQTKPTSDWHTLDILPAKLSANLFQLPQHFFLG